MIAAGRSARPPDDRLYPARPILAASIAVVRGGRVLLARRARPPGAGRFSLPGGLVELGETLEAAALRELREETAVEARITAFNRHVEVVEHDDRRGVRRHFVVASFVGCWIAGEGQVGPEAAEIAWASPDEIGALATTDHLDAVLAGAWPLAASAR